MQILLISASCRKSWTAEFIEACMGLRAADTYAYCIKAATCVQYGGSWMVQILGHVLKNWLLIVH